MGCWMEDGCSDAANLPNMIKKEKDTYLSRYALCADRIPSYINISITIP